MTLALILAAVTLPLGVWIMLKRSELVGAVLLIVGIRCLLAVLDAMVMSKLGW